MNLTVVKALVATNLALAAGLGSLWVDEHAQPRDVKWAEPAALLPDFSRAFSSTGAAPAKSNPIQYFSILERPVFAPDRKPPPPPAPPPAPDPMADVQISAIMTGDYEGVLARVEGRMRRVKVSEGIGAWTLQSVEGRQANFVSGDSTRQLQLAFSKFGVPVALARPAAGAQPTGVAAGAPINRQDQARDILRRRNEIRAARGLPLVTE